MKRNNLLVLVVSVCLFALLTESCKKENSCATDNCNSGTLNEETCNCECPPGFVGTNCELFQLSEIQVLLDGGQIPLDLFNAGIPLDSLYGKIYKGGLIFYLNTTDGSGMVAATEDQSDGAVWGCNGSDIIGLNNVYDCPGMGNCQQPSPEETDQGVKIGDGATNTDAILELTNGCSEDNIAAKLCRDLGPDWFLPSRGELNLIFTNLHRKSHGSLQGGDYWSSSEVVSNLAWDQVFISGGFSTNDKSDGRCVRAARSF